MSTADADWRDHILSPIFGPPRRPANSNKGYEPPSERVAREAYAYSGMCIPTMPEPQARRFAAFMAIYGAQMLGRGQDWADAARRFRSLDAMIMGDGW